MSAKKELKRTGPFKPVNRTKRPHENPERAVEQEGRLFDDLVKLAKRNVKRKVDHLD